jgi:hypothetical protein
MAFRDMHSTHKLLATVAIFALMGIELSDIRADRIESDSEQAAERERAERNFARIAAGINQSIQEGQRQFDITTSGLRRSLETEQATLYNTLSRASLIVRTITPEPMPLRAGVPVAFSIHYENPGDDTAQNVRTQVRMYVKRLDHTDDENEMHADFEREWHRPGGQRPSGPAVPKTKLLFGFSSPPLMQDQLISVRNHTKTLYMLTRIAWTDRTGRWLSDACSGLVNPTRDFTCAHPCKTGIRSRYPDRKKQSGGNQAVMARSW